MTMTESALALHLNTHHNIRLGSPREYIAGHRRNHADRLHATDHVENDVSFVPHVHVEEGPAS
jgi:hypothetical protein